MRISDQRYEDLRSATLLNDFDERWLKIRAVLNIGDEMKKAPTIIEILERVTYHYREFSPGQEKTITIAKSDYEQLKKYKGRDVEEWNGYKLAVK